MRIMIKGRKTSVYAYNPPDKYRNFLKFEDWGGCNQVKEEN